jgi:flagella basal body P-ring formation protein FlgA
MGGERGRAWSRLLVVLWMGCLAGAYFEVAEGASLKVEIPSPLAVRRGTWYLGEVGRLEGAAELVSRASKARLLFREGGWTQEDLWRSLGESGLVGETVELRMPSRVELLPEGEATAEVRRLSRWPWGLEVHAEGSPCGALVSPGDLPPGVRATVLRFRGSGGRECVVPVRIRWLVPAAVTLRALEGGAVIRPEDYRVALREWEGSASPPDPLSWPGQILVRPLPEEAVLMVGDVRRVPVVRRGAVVRLVYVVGGLRVEAWGETLQRGALGETIRVRNTVSRAVVSGVLVTPETVWVERK